MIRVVVAVRRARSDLIRHTRLLDGLVCRLYFAPLYYGICTGPRQILSNILLSARMPARSSCGRACPGLLIKLTRVSLIGIWSLPSTPFPIRIAPYGMYLAQPPRLDVGA
jgi:hypothetical protein